MHKIVYTIKILFIYFFLDYDTIPDTAQSIEIQKNSSTVYKYKKLPKNFEKKDYVM